MPTAHINRIATAVPPHDMHQAFLLFVEDMLPEGKPRSLYRRMARAAAIDHRYTFLKPIVAEDGSVRDLNQFYVRGNFPATARRMEAYEQLAPVLARDAIDKLALSEAERQAVTHVIVTTCTGLYAPGLDFEVIDHLRLLPSVERTLIGFMGCFAAINALKTARHIVRSQPGSRVLLLSLELCSLHLQETQDLEQLLAFTVFADGCAAYVVSEHPIGLAIDNFLAVRLPNTHQLITWRIGQQGFDMILSGQVPGELRRGLAAASNQITGCADSFSPDRRPIDLWAVHPGGRTILDAAEQGLALPSEALADSRGILLNYGNMSSASVMFVLERIMRRARSGQLGCAMSFGPGVTAETMMFHAV